jgi:hypothetical protein
VKNAKLALDAIALMLAYSQPKPAQQLDVRQATYQIIDPYRESTALPMKVDAQVLPAAAEPAPLVLGPSPRTLAERKAADWRAENELRQLQEATAPAKASAPAEPAGKPESEEARVLRLASAWAP